MPKTKRIGFIGLGAMGARMARRLIYAGYPLIVYNRTVEKADILIGLGARRAASPKWLAKHSDVIFTMVSNDLALQAVTEGELGTFAGARPGTIFIDCSTVSVKITKDLAQKAERLGFYWLDAPVLGSPMAAEAGELPFVVGGPYAVLELNREIFTALGKKIVWMGENGMGQAAKITHNLTCGIMLLVFSEAIVLGERFGLTRRQVLDILINGAVSCPLLEAKASKFENNDFKPSFALALMGKDLLLAKDASEDLGVPLPALSAAAWLYALAKNNGLGAEDSSAIIKALQLLAERKIKLQEGGKQ